MGAITIHLMGDIHPTQEDITPVDIPVMEVDITRVDIPVMEVDITPVDSPADTRPTAAVLTILAPPILPLLPVDSARGDWPPGALVLVELSLQPVPWEHPWPLQSVP